MDPVTAYVDREQKRVEFQAVLGPSKRANKLITDIENLAKQAGVDSPRLMTVAQRLLCLGLESEAVPAALEKMIDEFDLAGTRV